MGVTGPEHEPVSSCNDKSLQDAGQCSAADLYANGSKTGGADPDLAVIVEAWPRLDPQTRAAVLGLVRPFAG